MQEFILSFMAEHGYWGIALLIAIENIFPPIPSEIILTFGGFLTASSSLNVWITILCATAGSVAGAIVLYFVGRLLSTERLSRLFESRLGRILRLSREDALRADAFFARHGKKTVFFCRFIPIVRSVISLPAGSNKMNMLVFLPLTTLGALIWNTALIFLGRVAGEAWSNIAHYFDIYSTIALVVFALLAFVLVSVFVKKRFFPKLEAVPISSEKLDLPAGVDIEIKQNQPAGVVENKQNIVQKGEEDV